MPISLGEQEDPIGLLVDPLHTFSSQSSLLGKLIKTHHPFIYYELAIAFVVWVRAQLDIRSLQNSHEMVEYFVDSGLKVQSVMSRKDDHLRKKDSDQHVEWR